VFSSSVLNMLIGLVATPVLYRLLGPTRFGRYTFVMSVFMLFMIFVSSGVSDGVRKYLAEDRGEPHWNDHVIGFYLRLALVLALAGAAVLLVAVRSGLVASVVGPTFVPYFYLLTAMVLVAQFRTYVRRTLMGFGLERYSEPLNVVKKATLMGGAILMVYLGYGVWGVLVASLFAGALVTVVGAVLVLPRVSLSDVLRRTPDGFPGRELMQFNSLSILLVFLMMSMYHVDVIMLQLLVGSQQVGYYKAALKLAEFLWFVPLAIQTVFVHSSSELWSNDRLEKITELATRTTRYTILTTTVMALGIAALASDAVPLYFGPDATPAVGPLLLLLPGALGFAAARPLLAVEQGKGELRYPIIASGAAALINVVLNLLLIPRFGMQGAATATSVGYGSMFFFHVWSARRVGFDPLADARLGRVALTTLLAAGPILYLPTLVQSKLLSLLLVPPVGLVVFVALAVATGALDAMEPLEVLGSFPSPIGPLADRVEGRLRRVLAE